MNQHQQPAGRDPSLAATASMSRFRASNPSALGDRGAVAAPAGVGQSGPILQIDDFTSSALERLVARFGGLLRQVGRRRGLTEADAGELCQEVRIRLWHALASGERIAGAPASYVYRTAMSAALDMIRRRRARREESLEDRHEGSADAVLAGIATAPECERALEEQELAERVAQQVNALAEPRAVAVRMYLAGYNHREIAGLLRWTEAKARNLLYRGLAELRKKLTAAGIGPRGAGDRRGAAETLHADRDPSKISGARRVRRPRSDAGDRRGAGSRGGASPGTPSHRVLRLLPA